MSEYKFVKIVFFCTLVIGLSAVQFSCKDATPSGSNPTHIIRTSDPVTIDGKATEKIWSQLPWQQLDEVWLGKPFSTDDFQGRYKVTWDSKKLYVLAEIVDDKLVDTHPDGLDRYWDDDCLEIFIDENRSKGNHQYNHSAFAYHIALDGKVTDINTDSVPSYYNHVSSARLTSGNTTIWETSIDIYDDSYSDGMPATPVTLSSGKVMGFALAYCDNDNSAERENFIGSAKVIGKDKNRGWIDAGIFEEIILK